MVLPRQSRPPPGPMSAVDATRLLGERHYRPIHARMGTGAGGVVSNSERRGPDGQYPDIRWCDLWLPAETAVAATHLFERFALPRSYCPTACRPPAPDNLFMQQRCSYFSFVLRPAVMLFKWLHNKFILQPRLQAVRKAVRRFTVLFSSRRSLSYSRCLFSPLERV